MRKTLTIAVKTLLEAWRDRQLIIVYLAFPALMVLVYYVGFGQSTSMASFITVVVDNRDQGALGAEFVQALRAAMFDGLWYGIFFYLGFVVAGRQERADRLRPLVVMLNGVLPLCERGDGSGEWIVVAR